MPLVTVSGMTSGTCTVAGSGLYSGKMRRFNPEFWSGVAMFAVMMVAAGPVLFGGAPTVFPHIVWVGLFIVMLAALLGSAWGVEDPRRPRVRTSVLFGIAVLASWVLVVGSGLAGFGLVAILLVITVSICPYLLPTWVAWMLVVLNLVVLAASFVVTAAEAWGPSWFAEAAIMVGFYLLIQVATVLGTLAMLREQRARRELAEAHVELQAATALLAESTRTSERLRISRDLHDLIGHQLTVLTLELEAAKHRSTAGENVEPHIEKADGVARTLLSSVRETVGGLRHGDTELRETLQRVVQDLTEPRVALEVDDGLELDEERTVLLVRTAQEIITNTIRHARAEELWIEVRGVPSGVLLRSRDDGWGAREVVLGNGLRGIRERFEALGGSAAFDSSNGFAVTARMPTEDTEAAGPLSERTGTAHVPARPDEPARPGTPARSGATTGGPDR